MPIIQTRDFSHTTFDALCKEGMHPVLARVFAARGIERPTQLEQGFSALIPFDRLTHAIEAARYLADGIAANKRLLIVADYDSDGATACAVGMRALQAFGAMVDYVVPNRFEYGYGLTPELVRLAHETRRPDILITVDNGIASIEGVAEARSLGMEVLITDHHLPAERLPEAAWIVNPNQRDCIFPSKNLAGVGVMFYLLLALRAELRTRGAFSDGQEPNLSNLLDLVALGTIADVVRLDHNNRILVHQGLNRIRAGKACPGIEALLHIAGRDPRRATVYDLGYVAGPRLNAAGRIDDMALGIECLLARDPQQALAIARRLDELNRERREIEAGMQDSALASVDTLQARDGYTLTLHNPSWHQGVIGLLASRLKDRFHRPVVAFASGSEGELKGSGRSISGLHLRDALDLVSKRHPGLITRFGGHAAAAGLTIPMAGLEEFEAAFEAVAQTLLTPDDLKKVIQTDGSLQGSDLTLGFARLLEHQVWGHGFPQPAFADRFTVEEQRVVGAKHLKMKLRKDGLLIDAMRFFHNEFLPRTIQAVYRIGVNEYQGLETLQLSIDHWESC